MGDSVVGRGQHLFLGVEERPVLVVRERDGTGHRLYILGVRPGVTQGPVKPVIVSFGNRKKRNKRTVALAAVGQHKAGLANGIIDWIAFRRGAGPFKVAAFDNGAVLTVCVQQVGSKYVITFSMPGRAQREFPLRGKVKARVKVIDLEVVAHATGDRVVQFPRDAVTRACRHTLFQAEVHHVSVKQ